ncbi:MAG: RNA polymerase sigma factor [Candidatus Moranbacteria bacterium]|nr:RNA polymerase sigma factor [Candidatus Moranbacteria bacterium]
MELQITDRDKELIGQCKQGERNAQIKVYEMHAATVFNTCFRIVSNEADAEDIMQESFIEAFDKIHTFRGEGSFVAWLKRIAVNKSINLLRTKRKSISLEDGAPEVTDNSHDEASISENIFCRLEEIRAAMDKLPENYRIVLSLQLLEGYDQEEISEILGTTHGNVRTRYSRAKQKLLQIIMKERN